MRFSIHCTFGDASRLTVAGELADEHSAERPRWRVEHGYYASPCLVEPVLLAGIQGESLDDTRIQALLRAGLVPTRN